MAALMLLSLTGCGTTRWSDTSRTATEQLLISNAIDRAVGHIDFSPLSEQKIFINFEAVKDATDHKYLMMALRQHVASCGGVLCDERDQADVIVELRVGAIGTDRDDMLVGVPAFTLPAIPGFDYSSAVIPEIPFIKRTRQRGVAKIAAFAYSRHTGKPLWASGNNQGNSTARNLWIAGTGPLTRGSIYKKTTFAGDELSTWIETPFAAKDELAQSTFADKTRIFQEPQSQMVSPNPLAAEQVIPPQSLPSATMMDSLFPVTQSATQPLAQPPAR